MSRTRAKRSCRHITQPVCPWYVKFSQALAAGSPFAARPAIAGKNAPPFARDMLTMSRTEFTTACKGSPMKRAKLRGPKRNAAVVLGNIGTSANIDVLARAVDDDDAIVRRHAA